MKQRVWSVAIFGITMMLFVGASARAVDLILPLTETIHDEISVGVLGHVDCDPVEDSASLRFERLLTQDDISTMLEALENGGTVTVEYSTFANAAVLGDGRAGYALSVYTGLEPVGGPRIRLDRQDESLIAPPNFTVTTSYEVPLDLDTVRSLVEGQTFIVWALGSGIGWAVDCTPFDQAALNVDFGLGGRPEIWVRGLP